MNSKIKRVEMLGQITKTSLPSFCKTIELFSKSFVMVQKPRIPLEDNPHHFSPRLTPWGLHVRPSYLASCFIQETLILRFIISFRTGPL